MSIEGVVYSYHSTQGSQEKRREGISIFTPHPGSHDPPRCASWMPPLEAFRTFSWIDVAVAQLVGSASALVDPDGIDLH